METLTHIEVAILTIIASRGGRIRLGQIARCQPEKGIVKPRPLEKPLATRARRKKRRQAALDGLVLKGMTRRMIEWRYQPGPNPTVFELTARGREWMREHGTRGSVLIPE